MQQVLNQDAMRNVTDSVADPGFSRGDQQPQMEDFQPFCRPNFPERKPHDYEENLVQRVRVSKIGPCRSASETPSYNSSLLRTDNPSSIQKKGTVFCLDSQYSH